MKISFQFFLFCVGLEILSEQRQVHLHRKCEFQWPNVYKNVGN